MEEIYAEAEEVEIRPNLPAPQHFREASTLMSYYKCAMMEIETKLMVLNQEFSLLYDRNPINNIKTRLKSPESIREKMIRKNLPPSISAIENNIFDIAGVRVICSFIDDVYLLAEALIRQDDVRLIRYRDYIDNPKNNGYRSLHLVVSIPIFLLHEKQDVKVEIQLRTVAMDSWASLEHQLCYKKNLDALTQATVSDELFRCAELSNDLDTRMNDLLHVILPDRL